MRSRYFKRGGIHARYFFHLQDGRGVSDTMGTVLDDADAARVEAVAVAGEQIKDFDKAFWTNRDWQMHVVDEAGATVCKLRFASMAD